MSKNKDNGELQYINNETSNKNQVNIESEDIDLSTETNITWSVGDSMFNSTACKLSTFFFSAQNKQTINLLVY